MPEMPHDELGNVIDAICARLQTDLQGQLAQLEERHRLAGEQIRRDAESQAAQQWAAKLELVKSEWQTRLDSELAAAAADAERRLTAETKRVRDEAERAAAASGERVRQEAVEMAERTREEAAQSVERVRKEMDAAVTDAVARVREEMQQAASESTNRLRREMDEAAAQSSSRAREEMDAERQRLSGELEAERSRAQTELSAERERSSAELEAERLKVQSLTAAVSEAQALLARERESARSAAEASTRARDQQAITDARAAERESQLAIVERLSHAMRAMGNARSLSDTLTALMSAAASLAPRAAVFIVNGRELQGWRASGFTNNPASIRLPLEDTGLLSTARATGTAVSTSAMPAPSFAALSADRAGIAVPVIVGGQSVAVLYADDGSSSEPEAPASWPEAMQMLAAHASTCLAYITALRTTQAMRATAAGGGARRAAPGTEEDSSARRYARLLVSEIKLYNEGAVRVGREKRDLLHRLRNEIERARRLYEERVSPSVGARATYFEQELVQTLADGDATLLGEAV
jgi:chemotaxis protein histidine kinase CheA